MTSKLIVRIATAALIRHFFIPWTALFAFAFAFAFCHSCMAGVCTMTLIACTFLLIDE
jgi:hypothetical protein